MKQITIPSTKWKDLSDLLDTHQDRPTEVRHRDQVKIITTPWTRTQTLRKARVTVEAGGIEDIAVISKGGDSVALIKSLERGRLL
ncbi:Nucleic acid-binding OB-fold [Penicillium canescens]|uniref:Nucleic acid-binding OB-fold n=1 Tax=Penicillium canescens TaxID=5083 RepID=A0AAD6IFF6_PENCN|nr:Nucleic acid-binding OB-fold [Penicillium canescens]KAJ5996236.1 Nucleic acid-binding OB-fold [Penicillium canescens]KAJ6044944.1 Nucleic acid-binding OB-fold [Penicillium canescens]KAJ6056413.1 Nucleic acid-binding OB-fold [Penicillium canescens]KAJ6075364.1 Nucleic acid-binding OB-fold [Penicillium canescens]KAJ6175629.1 Nucleic acid-binding OB-fold [Penicillium canescens]